MEEDQREKSKIAEKGLKLTASSIDKKIPKYVNRVIFNRTEGNIVMSLIVIEKTFEGEQGTLVESIIVDKDHARQIAEVLSKFLEQEENK